MHMSSIAFYWQTTMMAVNSVADFGCLVWLNRSHVKQLDAQSNEALKEL